MSFFYFDDEMKGYEEQLNFNPIIQMLEVRFNNQRNPKILTTLIGCSWYYLLEGKVNQTPYNYDEDFLLSKWKQFVDIGISDFSQCADVCLIIAYTLNLLWFYLGKEYEKVYSELYRKSIEIGQDNNIGKLSSHLYLNSFTSRSKKYNRIEYPDQICQDLFPTDSILDCYFREILSLEITK